MRYERPQLNKQERKRILLEIAELARQIRYKADYLFFCRKDEEIGCGCMDLIDVEYFNNRAYSIDEHAIGLIHHYNLQEIAIEEE